ncbi:MAG: sigma-70 family RNA polymerase sigma factor [Acidobacteria bacterium]|nr:sigma-70 family RNA polymerase sigma factor [Acidobacteriota bacterium]
MTMSEGPPPGRTSDTELSVTASAEPETGESGVATFDDVALCQACARGDPSAWEEFYRRYRPFLLRVALKISRNAASAEELVSQIIVLLMEKNKLAQYGGRGSLPGWLRAVVVHYFLDEQRRARRFAMDSLSAEQVNRMSAPATESDCRRHFSPPLLADCARYLYRHLRRLPADKAGFMNMYYFQQMTLAESAAALGIHESTASRWNARVTRKLQRDLVQFMRRQHGWSPSEVYDFLEKCLEFISQHLETFRRRAETEENLQDFENGTSH